MKNRFLTWKTWRPPLLVSIFALPLIGSAYYFSAQSNLNSYQSYGEIDDFEILSFDPPMLVQKEFLENRITLIAYAGQQAEKAMAVWTNLISRSKEELVNPNPHDLKPKKPFFIFQTLKDEVLLELNQRLEGLGLTAEKGEVWLSLATHNRFTNDRFPEAEINSECFFMVLSQDLRIVEVASCEQPEVEASLFQVLIAETSKIELFTYLKSQALMWRRSKYDRQ